MGMTIDKTIEFYNGLECYTPQAKEAKDVAISTMRKYLKICKILDKSDNAEQCMYDTIQEIEEVRDGNGD